MRSTAAIGAALAAALAGMLATPPALQAPAVRSVDQESLREYTGAYRWEPDAYLYLQLWHEFAGFDKPAQLVAFDESGEVRVLYPTDGGQFFSGPGVAVASAVESRIEFQRDAVGRIISLRWRRVNGASRVADRVAAERRQEVRFANGNLQLAGTLISPASEGKHPAIILVHGSGPEDREYVLPWARFLIRRGVAILGYDKRGVGGSAGDWKTASFEDLAGDVVAAFEYLKTRDDIDRARIGLLGISQAGWIMPLAAVRAKDVAFLISISGAGVQPAETTIDQAQHEMTARGMKPQMVAEILALMKLQYEFARTGRGWDEYAAARAKIAARMGQPPASFPGTPDDPHWQTVRRTYFYDPDPVLRQLQVPVLALFGDLDNNILAGKNKAAWETALRAAGNRDLTLAILPRANHGMFEAQTGSNAEAASLQRFVPAYFDIVEEWLVKRVRAVSRPQ